MVYVIQVCWQLASRIRMELRSILILHASCQQICLTYTIAMCIVKISWWCVPSRSCSQAVNKPVWHIPLLCVQWKTPDDGQRNCPKHVEFHSKNKFEELVHLVGFILRNLTWCMGTWKSNKKIKFTHIIGKSIRNWTGSKNCTTTLPRHFNVHDCHVYRQAYRAHFIISLGGPTLDLQYGTGNRRKGNS